MSGLPRVPTHIITQNSNTNLLPSTPSHFLGAKVPTHKVEIPQKTKEELQKEYNILLYEIYSILITSCKNTTIKSMNDKLINLSNQINSKGGTRRKNIYNTRKRKNKKRLHTRRKNN